LNKINYKKYYITFDFCLWFPRLLSKWIQNFSELIFILVFKFNRDYIRIFLYVLLLLINILFIHLFLFNNIYESLNVGYIDKFNLATEDGLYDGGEYNTNMYDPVKDAVNSNLKEQSNIQEAQSSSGGNNEGPTSPQPNRGGNHSFGANNAINERTDTDKLADYLRPFQGMGARGGNGTLSQANITAIANDNNPNRNYAMIRIASHVRIVRPDLFSDSGFGKTRISAYFLSELDAMKLNFPK